jgi:CheY-like chemotaxis protein
MKKQILLVANENDVLESFPVTLALAGHGVKLAHNGLQAIKQARDTSPDLIVLDATLPDMDGSTVMDILRRLPSTNHIPALLLKPRPHRLMPLPLQNEAIRAGSVRPLDTGEMLMQVANTIALCERINLAEREWAEEVV